MNRKQITITLAGLGIMAIAAVGCASTAVSADDELNIDNTPVIGSPAEPNTDPNDSVEHLNPSTPDETGIFPTEDPNAEPDDVIDYPSSTLASATANFRYLSSQATASATVRSAPGTSDRVAKTPWRPHLRTVACIAGNNVPRTTSTDR